MANNPKLSYNGLWYSPPLVQDNPDANCTENSLPLNPDTEGENFIPVKLTTREFTELLSALMVGAQISYPEQFQRVVWILLRQVECSMDLCDLIAECIANAEPGSPLWNALNDFVSEWGSGNNLGGGGSNVGLFDGLSCENDNVFATALQFVELLNATSVDVYDVVEAANNNLEAVGDVLILVPPFGQVISVVNVIVDSFALGYDAQYTNALRDELACEIFCLILDNDCEVTMVELMQFFAGKLSISISLLNFSVFISYLTAQAFTGADIVYATFLSILGVVYFGGKYAGLDLTRFTRSLAAIQNDTNSDWSVLCDECEFTWCHTFDFTEGQLGWTPNAAYGGNPGVYVSGVGFVSEQNGPNGNANSSEVCSIEYIGMSERTVTRCVIMGTTTCASGTFNRWFAIDGNFTNECPSFDPVLDRSGLSVVTTEPTVFLQTGWDGSITITGITLYGEGENPFGGDNC